MLLVEIWVRRNNGKRLHKLKPVKIHVSVDWIIDIHKH